jgi:TolB protein
MILPLLLFVTALLLSLAIAPSTIAQLPGGKIAFSSDRDGNREIYVMNADGTSQVRLTNNISFDDVPEWSPDGKKIAFLSYRGDGTWAVFVMNHDGSGRREVTQVNVPNLSEHISWSPDGRHIAFQSVENGTEKIFVVNSDGTGRQAITNGSYPSWSPDGSKILFSTGNALYTIRPDGSDLQLVLRTDPTRDIYNVHEPGWSPDGQNIIFGVADSWDFISIFTARSYVSDIMLLSRGQSICLA